MITTEHALCAAEAWVRETADEYPELVGVVLAGSTRRRERAAPHPLGSDIDLFLYVDAEVPSDILEPRGRFAPRKLTFHGVLLEPSFHDARCLADPETVLGDMHLAPLFTDPVVLLDPQGRIRTLAAAVTPEFPRRRHAERRLQQALKAAALGETPFAVPEAPALQAPCWRNIAFGYSIMRCALAIIVADLRSPTTRRSLVVAREVLATTGRTDIGDELLRLLGSLHLRRAEVRDLAAEAEHTYDIALAARRTPVVMDWNVSLAARALERAAIHELIDDGHHREALFQLLLVRTVAQGIIENDGAGDVRERTRFGYHRLLAALGIGDDPALLARAQAIRAFAPALRGVCEALLARAPGVID